MVTTYSEVPNKRVTFFPASPGQASWGKCNTLIRNFRVVPVKSKVKILQNFVAFSEYMNFNILQQAVFNNFKQYLEAELQSI